MERAWAGAVSILIRCPALSTGFAALGPITSTAKLLQRGERRDMSTSSRHPFSSIRTESSAFPFPGHHVPKSSHWRFSFGPVPLCYSPRINDGESPRSPLRCLEQIHLLVSRSLGGCGSAGPCSLGIVGRLTCRKSHFRTARDLHCSVWSLGLDGGYSSVMQPRG